MQVKLTRSYRSQKGNTVFVYEVNGSEAQIEAYKAAQGKNYRETEDGIPLWFTVNCIGKRGELVITNAGKIVPDMSEFEQAASLVKQYGGNFGDILAQKLIGGLLGDVPKAEGQKEAQDSGLGKM